MYRFITLLAVAVLQVCAQPRHDGEILSSKPWPALPDFDSLDAFSRNYFPKSVYDDARTQGAFDVLDITYASDDFDVRGLLVRPRDPGARMIRVSGSDKLRTFFNRGWLDFYGPYQGAGTERWLGRGCTRR